MQQPADGDPKSGIRDCRKRILTTDSSGRFIIGRNSVPMRLWQHVDPSGKLHYSLLPAAEDAAKTEETADTLLASIKIEEGEGQQGIQKTSHGTTPSVGPLAQARGMAVDFYTCDKCEMKFPRASMLHRHKTSHDLNAWFIKKRLNNKRAGRARSNSGKRDRQVLARNSSEKRRYACNSCDFGCSERSALTVHVRKEHKLTTSDGSGKCPCTVCSYKCNSLASLHKHMEEHRDAKTTQFSCNTCSFVCKRSSTLVSHVVQNHRKIESAGSDSKKRCKVAKCNDESLEAEDSKETRLQKEIKDSIVPCAPPNLECKKEPSMTTRASKKNSRKTTEEQCDLCDFKCSKKSALYTHKRQHKTADVAEVYSCNECTFKTNKKSSLYSHIKRKHKVSKTSAADSQPELFYCNQCDYKNKNKYELKIHVARKHTDDFKFSCETCGKKFKVKGDLTNHIRFNHKEQPVICDVCGKTCLNSNSLYVHQKFAHYKAKYECQVCKRRMVSQENLNEHMIRQHERRENVVCEECGKTFSRNSRLKVHMRIHTGDKPYTCTICSKSFARRTALKQHLLIHTGIRPYVCDICGKAFTQKPGLISHRKSHPGSHPPLPRVLIDHILNDVMNN